MQVKILKNDDDRLADYEVGAVVDMVDHLAERWSVRGKVEIVTKAEKPQAKRVTQRKRKTNAPASSG